MRKLPCGISNYEKIVTDNAIYVDKTMYIQKLEEQANPCLMFLRPRKFGKTLFTNMLACYYDINKKQDFERLFQNTYIGKNPTKERNNYYILKFNFSGIDTSTFENTITNFRSAVEMSIEDFLEKYNLKMKIKENYTAEELLNRLFIYFKNTVLGGKIYVIIDEYDQFANELLGYSKENFKNIMSRNGKVRKWYEALKRGTESVVERIFITGVSPISLDSLTSGFNIVDNITCDTEFNEMLGFNYQDLLYIMDELEFTEKEKTRLLPILKQNYDGYVCSKPEKGDLEQYKIYNSNMVLYFLNKYSKTKTIPTELVDPNIISDMGKIEGTLDLMQDESRFEVLNKIISGENVFGELVGKFNLDVAFEQNDLISILYYLGYLTIKENKFDILGFGSPNDVISNVYAKYFLTYISKKVEINISKDSVYKMLEGMLLEGKLDLIMSVYEEYLSALSNRDFIRANEGFVKGMFYVLARNLGVYFVKSELEHGGMYSDLLLIPMQKQDEYYSILLEFKYIKKEELDKNGKVVQEKMLQAKEQLNKYLSTEEIQMLPKVKAYAVVVAKDKVTFEEVER